MPRSGEIDDDTRDLVARILTRAGAIMEDASVLALTPFTQEESIAETIGNLERASFSVGALIGAAKLLSEGK